MVLYAEATIMYCSIDLLGHMRPVRLPSSEVIHSTFAKVAGQKGTATKVKDDGA